MKKRYVKSVNASGVKEVYERIREADSLGLVVDVSQLAEKGDFWNPGMFKIDLFLPVKEEEELTESSQHHVIAIGGAWLREFNVNDDGKLFYHNTTASRKSAIEFRNRTFEDGETLLSKLYEGLCEHYFGETIKILEVK
ncbi:hypothetical protein [Bacillus atrophaeus]|uniref:hypothetical protein n=1 Tax=Bacillus atrophaeus TaxID=1452 RepID=UPI002DBC9C8D|nr:hypothetical protein [Bacillus atrophaeus]MEC0765071.1 hypothetical protein [Bacillus atrophaeus]MEC0778258.1 hypothetical protein [Bacillus atrophaeus]MEC0808294.1 hypothetical protein [Bacillus atrophaeus]